MALQGLKMWTLHLHNYITWCQETADSSNQPTNQCMVGMLVFGRLCHHWGVLWESWVKKNCCIWVCCMHVFVVVVSYLFSNSSRFKALNHIFNFNMSLIPSIVLKVCSWRVEQLCFLFWVLAWWCSNAICASEWYFSVKLIYICKIFDLVSFNGFNTHLCTTVWSPLNLSSPGTSEDYIQVSSTVTPRVPSAITAWQPGRTEECWQVSKDTSTHRLNWFFPCLCM